MRACILTALLTVGLTAAASAHEPGLSALEVRMARSSLVVDLSMAAKDAEDARSISSGDLGAFAASALDLRVDGQPLRATSRGVVNDSQGVRIRLVFERPAGSALVVRSMVPHLLARGHRQLLSVLDEHEAVLAERMLGASHGEQMVDLGTLTPSAARTAGNFFVLGIEHILGGYDHLLFLAGLLMVVTRIRELVTTVTAFTIAHSMTLGLATIARIGLPSLLVEPLIAASIVFVGLDNLMRRQTGNRAVLTFAFGLIHGFGFAGALSDLGLGATGTGIAVPLAAFNIGVETGQVAVALAVIPLLAWLRRHPSVGGARVTTMGSLLVLVAGAYWLAERTVRFL